MRSLCLLGRVGLLALMIAACQDDGSAGTTCGGSCGTGASPPVGGSGPGGSVGTGAAGASGTSTTSSTSTTSTSSGGGGGAGGFSIQFFGNGTGDIDRVKIPIDEPPPDVSAGPPADVGAEDFTLEFWIAAEPGANDAGAVQCGENLAWINGNIVFDRDRYNQDRKFGLSLAGGRLVFGVSGDGTGDATICGDTTLDDGEWHHVAALRRRQDGRLSLFVDGGLDAEGDGPDGDVSYPDDGVPGSFCGGPCTNSDPFLVIGAEKHDAGPAYPPFTGRVDEVRLSRVLRYGAPFARPTTPFNPDADTVALYSFDDPGPVATDSSGAASGPSHGTIEVGGTPVGPVFVEDSPF